MPGRAEGRGRQPGYFSITIVCMIYTFQGKRPRFEGERIFTAPSADVIGDVILAEDSSIWFNTTLRGDLQTIVVGRGSNVQDGSTLHTDYDVGTVVGENVTIGHNCVVHGCRVGDGTLIGMGSVILSGAKIGRNCLIGGGSLVTGGMDIPDGMLVLGSPAKIVRALDADAVSRFHANTARYVRKKDEYLAEGMGSGALGE